MKRISLFLAAAALAALPLAGCDKHASVKTDDQKISYGIGLDIGRSMKQRGIEIDPATVAAGIRDGQSGASPRSTSRRSRRS